ncbi:LysE family translocator [Chitinimonas sp.]|uniref:LysE family translocator n=1 Tax=Chitinimonas sp. TaxID=1934313 RepID=UPI0035B48786
MSYASELWLYFLVVGGVVVLPGMDMAFVMGNSLTSGRQVGLAAVAGIVMGGLCHTIIAAAGISALFKLFPAALTAMLLAGAGYIAWIGTSLIRVSSLTAPSLAGGQRSAAQSFAGAMATCLLNPKAYLFMLAIFPQFLHAGRGPIWLQASLLGLITALVQLAVYGTLALLAARAQTALAAHPRANAAMARSVGMVLLLAAALTLYRGLAG